MKPTMKLRFVKRAMKIDEHTAQYTTVLQQWWEKHVEGKREPVGGEWRDVPVETEETK